MGCRGVVPSHLLVVGVFVFLVWGVFLFVCGWERWVSCPHSAWFHVGVGGMRMGKHVA